MGGERNYSSSCNLLLDSHSRGRLESRACIFTLSVKLQVVDDKSMS